MEPILVYGFPAGSSMGLIAALEWLGSPYRLARVDMLGEMREPAYRRINPRVETPVLICDDGRTLTETLAIAHWLAARDAAHRVSFAPLTPEADRMNQLMGFINTGFTGAFGPLWVATEAPPSDPVALATLVELGRTGVVKRHDQLEQIIGDTPYLMGDHPTLADGLLVGVARWLEVLDVADRDRWPRLSALRARLEADPAVVFATQIEAGEPASGTGACLGHVPLAKVIDRFGT